VRVIRKQVVKQVLDLLDEVAEKRPEDYLALWKAYGAVLKEGLHFEPENKDRLAKLVRFESSKSDAPTSLPEYVKRMSEGQKAIYYIYGPSRRTLEASPHLESLGARGYEVLYMTDPVDEFAVRGLGAFEDKPLISATDEKLDLGATDQDEKSKQQTEEKTAELKPLIERFREVLKEQVSEVRVSDRLTDSPSCLVVPEGGLGPYIERLLRMQQGADMPATKRILELNPQHPLVRSLSQLHARDANATEVAEYIELVYDQALLSEGSPIDDPARVAKRLARLLEASVSARAAG
jgi:molecular chaperone HtpG